MTESSRSIDTLLAADAAARELGVDVHHAQPGRVEVGLIVTESMLNFGGTCHGGVLFQLADIAMSFVSNQDQPMTVATAASIDYLSPAGTGDDLRAVVTTTSGGRNAIHDGVISVGERTVALFRGKTLRLKRANDG